MKGALALFLYVGAQVGTWSFFILLYVQQYAGITEKTAGYMLSRHFGCFYIRQIIRNLVDEAG